MVVSLIGKVRGEDVIFRQNEAGRWETAVPASPDGTYIIELWARDYAGNTGYFATIKVTYDPARLCYSIDIVNVGSQFTMEQVAQILNGEEIKTEVFIGAICCEMESDPIKSEIVRCEVCGQ